MLFVCLFVFCRGGGGEGLYVLFLFSGPILPWSAKAYRYKEGVNPISGVSP